MFTQEYLKSILHYDPETGLFTWKVYRKRTKGIGSRADIPHHKGYRQLGIDKNSIPAHRVAFFYMTGRWPKNLIDHKDNNRSNNKWDNLREATNSQNLRNTKARNNTGYKGVYKAPRNKFRAVIVLGTFDTAEEASKIYKEAALKLHGEFAHKSIKME